jgi:hypothetical protein
MNNKKTKNEKTILNNIKFIMATTKTTIKAIVAFKTITKNSSTQKRRISASDFSKSDDPININNNNKESSVPNNELDSTQNRSADENDESDSGYNDNELTPRNKQQKTVKLKEQQKTVQLIDPSKDSKRKSSLPAKKSPSSSNSNSRKSSIVSNGGGSNSGKSSRKSSTSKKSGGGLPSFMIPTASSLKKKEDAIAYQKIHGVEPGSSKPGKGKKGNKRRTSAGDAIRRRKLARRRASIPPHLMITEASIIESLE